MIFGLPGAALAMYQCAKPEKKKAAGGLLLSAALACMAVSYTHLDVYKRQQLHMVERGLFISRSARAEVLLRSSTEQ